jgi:hypothetical protein
VDIVYIASLLRYVTYCRKLAKKYLSEIVFKKKILKKNIVKREAKCYEKIVN